MSKMIDISLLATTKESVFTALKEEIRTWTLVTNSEAAIIHVTFCWAQNIMCEGKEGGRPVLVVTKYTDWRVPFIGVLLGYTQD